MAHSEVARCGRVPAYAGMLVLWFALTVWVMPLGAITGGESDGDQHPNVGAVIVRSNRVDPFVFCSGTLIDKDILLTFGRSAQFLKKFLLDKPGNGGSDVEVFVSFSSDKALTAEEGWLPVVQAVTHPDYNPGRKSNPRDVGILILEGPVTGITPAELPLAGFLDDRRAEGNLSRRQRTEFTVAGYSADGVRRVSVCEYLNLHKVWLHMSQNQAPSRGDIGTSYGDFGGPVFWVDEEDGTEILVAITFSGDSQRVATGYRVDIPGMWDFIPAYAGTSVTTNLAPPGIVNRIAATWWGLVRSD
jgi:hypothetical protein